MAASLQTHVAEIMATKNIHREMGEGACCQWLKGWLHEGRQNEIKIPWGCGLECCGKILRRPFRKQAW